MTGPLPEGMPAAAVVAHLQTWARRVGLRLTGTCQHCGHPVWSPDSIRHRAGPTCRRKNTKKDGHARTSAKIPSAAVPALTNPATSKE